MPPFVSSFQDQFFAVMINLVGTVLANLFTALFNSFSTSVINPLLQAFIAQLGLGN